MALIVTGFDPGTNPANPGGMALVSDGVLQDAVDLPTADRDVHDGAVAVQIERWRDTFGNPSRAYIERITKRPGAAKGMEKLFICYGVIRGVVASYGIPSMRIMPGVWKKALKLTTAGTDAQQREACRSLASMLMPEGTSLWLRQRDAGRATAALIAYYGYQELTRTPNS